MDLLTPSSTGRFQLCLYLSLATKGFWLPREGVAKPQVSPLDASTLSSLAKNLFVCLFACGLTALSAQIGYIVP